MPSYISLALHCKECKRIWDELVDREDRSEGKYPNCPGCGSSSINETITKINTWDKGPITKKPQGRDKDYVESLKLEAESYNKAPDKRDDYRKEIKKLRSI